MLSFVLGRWSAQLSRRASLCCFGLTDSETPNVGGYPVASSIGGAHSLLFLWDMVPQPSEGQIELYHDILNAQGRERVLRACLCSCARHLERPLFGKLYSDSNYGS